MFRYSIITTNAVIISSKWPTTVIVNRKYVYIKIFSWSLRKCVVPWLWYLQEKSVLLDIVKLCSHQITTTPLSLQKTRLTFNKSISLIFNNLMKWTLNILTLTSIFLLKYQVYIIFILSIFKNLNRYLFFIQII